MEFRQLIFVFTFYLLAVARAQNNPVVETSLGKIRGSTMKTAKGVNFNAFRGIRYAQAPIGDKRFQAPVAVSKWEGELDATKDGLMCPQPIVRDKNYYSEDCLVLNVYSKDFNANKSVIVYIHGGSFKNGGSHSDTDAGPQLFMDSDIVFVSMNYRLGAFGFLSTRTAEARGNFAFLDQIMGLQWVHDHISKFGGNPNSVTLFGYSAGAMAASLHMASPLSNGLFHKVAAMSGSGINEHSVDNLYWTRRLAHETSCPMFNPDDVLSCLRKLSWEKVVEVCQSWELYSMYDMKWNYEVDGHFLHSKPSSLFAAGNFSKVPLITGLTKNEFDFYVYANENNTGLLNDVNSNFDKYAPIFFMHDFKDKADKIKNFYLGNKTIMDQPLKNFGKILSDSFITHGVHRLVDLARKHIDVFYYSFDYQGKFSVMTNSEGKSRGVSHGDDLIYYIHNNNEKTQINVNDQDWFMVERMVGLVTAFASNGSTLNVGEVKWLPSDKSKIQTFIIDKDVKMADDPLENRFKLWDELFPVGSQNGSSSIKTISLLSSTLVLVNYLFKYMF